MADSISITAKLAALLGSANLPSDTISVTLTPNAADTDLASGTQSIGTSAEEAIDEGPDVGGNRIMLLFNQEAVGGNYVEIGFATGGSFAEKIRLLPQTCFLAVIPSGTTVYAKADTAAVRIYTKVVEYNPA